MRIINFLKNLRKKEIQKLRIEELKDYTDPIIKKSTKKAESEINQLKEQIEETKKETLVALSLLENAEFRNEKIPERIKQMALGNKEIYLQKIKSLINNSQIPEELASLPNFAEEFDKTMSSFSEKIGKSHTVLSEVFPKETGTIAVNIKKIDGLIKRMKETLENPYLEKLRKLEDKITEAENKIRQNEKNIKKIKEKELNENGIKAKEKEIAKIKSGEEYLSFLKKINNKENLKTKLKDLENGVAHSFSEIEAALKRYSNLNKEDNLAKSYLNSHLNSLLEDEKLEILTLTKKIKTYIEEGSIELKDKKKISALNELERLNESYFREFLSQRAKTKNEINQLESEITNSPIEKKLKETEKEMDGEIENFNNRKKEIEKLNKEIESFDLQKLKEELEKEFNKTTGKNIKII